MSFRVEVECDAAGAVQLLEELAGWRPRVLVWQPTDIDDPNAGEWDETTEAEAQSAWDWECRQGDAPY